MKQRIQLATVHIIFVTLLFGCATNEPKLIAPKKAQVIINNVSKKVVMDNIALTALENGGLIKEINEYGVIIEYEIEHSFNTAFFSGLAYGNDYNDTPMKARIHLNILQLKTNVKLIGSKYEVILTHGKTGHEKSVNSTKNSYSKIQNKLNKIKNRIESL
ncbi:MAG: hypothetical protein HOE44_13540 [Candidatus Marinimicrobia bacterium]|jgi:hypothetical protein|nr:hypothetical protein [Candidatus Neomarinimicrobiota bacterium]